MRLFGVPYWTEDEVKNNIDGPVVPKNGDAVLTTHGGPGVPIHGDAVARKDGDKVAPKDGDPVASKNGYAIVPKGGDAIVANEDAIFSKHNDAKVSTHVDDVESRCGDPEIYDAALPIDAMAVVPNDKVAAPIPSAFTSVAVGPFSIVVKSFVPTSAKIKAQRATDIEAYGNNNVAEKLSQQASIIPPFRQKTYGAIPTNSHRNDDSDSDDESDYGGSNGFPSEAGWSTRMYRRQSSVKPESCCLQYIGIYFILCYTIFSSLSGLTVKLLESTYHPYNICFWRFATVGSISLIIIAYTKLFTNNKLWPRPLVEEKHEHLKNVFLLTLRGILGCGGRILYIFSITCMNLSDAMVIASSSPVFMTFFAYFLLGESCGVVPIIVAFITLVGVGIITRPPWLTGQGHYDAEVLLGTGTGVGGMILTTLVMIVMRKLRHVNVSLITLSFASCGVVAAGFLCVKYDVFVVPRDNFGDIGLLFASGATSFLGQTFLTLGLKYESAGVVALLSNFAVVFSFIFEYIFIHVQPDIYSITGGFIVILCIVVTTLRKWIGNLPVYSDIRERFWFLLV